MDPKRDPLHVGLAGYGTVGSGLGRLLAMNAEAVERRLGRRVVIDRVLVRDLHKPRAAPYPEGAELFDDVDAFLQGEVDVVVECLGGKTTAKDILLRALAAGRHVVTANKALLAEDGADIFALAAQKGLHLGYEAAIAGGIPIVQPLKEDLAGNRVTRLMGILNGTCNYILTQMTATGMAYEEALAKAQELGYAEADPTLDVEGGDAAHKLCLLIRLAFGVHYPFERLCVFGISIVEPMDIAFAGEFGYTVKLIGEAREKGGKISAGVFPALAPNHYLLASVQGAMNAVRIKGNAVGPVMLYGQGAGDLPTASAVMADIMTIARGCPADATGFAEALPKADILDLDETVTPHYLRVMVPDRPGMLRDLAGIMARHHISLAQVVQKGQAPGKSVPIVFFTHECRAMQVHAAMHDIREEGLTAERIMHLRIL